jgi:hypothetical protein
MVRSLECAGRKPITGKEGIEQSPAIVGLFIA